MLKEPLQHDSILKMFDEQRQAYPFDCSFPGCPNPATNIFRVEWSQGIQPEKDDYLSICSYHTRAHTILITKD